VNWELSSAQFFKAWFQELFFLAYHMPGLGGYHEILSIPVFQRKYFIHEFIDQKEKEAKAIEKERKKS